ncbi:MAG: hypothetical protein K2X49_21800 [Acetobacteraceae bacterium]|nr:hypothetical protein [Acetobacteraceae bacterium]
MAAPSPRRGGRTGAESAPRAALGLDRPLLIGHDMDPDAVTLRNFDAPEDDFAWSMGRYAEVEFTADGAGPLRLLLDIDVFRAPPVLTGQNVLVYVNGLRLHSAFVTGRSMLEIPMGAGVLQPAGNTLVFDLPDAIRPLEFGMDDGRMLGVKLFSLTLEPGDG